MSTDVVPISASPTLATLCTAGVLSAADIHLATMVCRLCHESEESVRLALALTSRELRHGSVFLNPRTIRETILTQLDQERELLENKINGLRTFESEYRSNLRGHLESLLAEVGSDGDN